MKKVIKARIKGGRERGDYSSPEVFEQVNRLNRLSGQICGIARMVEEGRQPTDVLTQLKAVRSALNAVEQHIVECAFTSGIEHALESQDKSEIMRRLEELKPMMRLRTPREAAVGGAGDGGSSSDA